MHFSTAFMLPEVVAILPKCSTCSCNLGKFFYKRFFGRIGKHSILRPPLLLLNTKFIEIGNNVFIRDNVRLEVLAVNNNDNPHLVIGDDTNIEQNVHIACHERITIGDRVSIAAHVAIVDVAHYYSCKDESFAKRIAEGPSAVSIGNDTFIGYGSVILPNVRIGSHVVIGANSVVCDDIPNYCIAAGAPAKVIKCYEQRTENEGTNYV